MAQYFLNTTAIYYLNTVPSLCNWTLDFSYETHNIRLTDDRRYAFALELQTCSMERKEGVRLLGL